MAAVGQDDQFRTGDLVVHLAAQAGVALIVVAGHDQGRDMDGRQAVHILNGFQVAVDDELSVLAPHRAVQLPVGGRSANGIVGSVGARAVKEGEVAGAPGQFFVLFGVAAVLPCFTLAEQASLFQLIQPPELLRRHLGFFLGKNLVHLPGRRKRDIQNQVAEVLLILEGVGLGQNAAIAVAKERDLAKMKCDANILDIFHHGLDSVEAGIMKALGPA